MNIAIGFRRFRSPRLLVSAVTALGLAVAACGGGGGGGGADCSVAAQKQFVLDVTRDWYLFLDLLPANINPAAYSSASELLNALTAEARAQGKDRFFSFMTTTQSEQSFFSEGQAIAFGVGTQLRGAQSDHLFISKVEPNSPSSEAGFVRGDEILAIGPSADQLTPVSTLQQQPGGASAAFGPSDVGVVRSFSVRTLAGQTVTRTMTKRVITLVPVPVAAIAQRTGLTPVGYIAFETFITPAEQPLRNAFAAFAAQGVRDVIVDLRYNGGGLITVGQLLANLLASNQAGQVMFRTTFNSRHTDQNQTTLFATQPQALPALRIAFIATNATASASELVINSLEPYAQVAIIGSTTFGKPVGQAGFQQPGCDAVLRLIAFRDVNRDNEGDFFQGLPDAQFSGAFCAADDDLTHARESTLEASTGTALAWINNNACPAAKALRTPIAYPMPERPNIVQEQRPGLF